MRSDATTIEEYLSSLDPELNEIISNVRTFLLSTIPIGVEENMRWGMITYEIPLTRYPDTYNRQPLMFAALAVQKRYCSLYLIPAYVSKPNLKTLIEGYSKAGKKLNMGKSCIRFKRIEDLEFPLIGSIISSFTVDSFIEATRKAKGPT